MERGGAEIKAADRSDAEALADLALALWPSHERSEMKEEAVRWIESDRNEALLATEAGRYVGFALLSIRTDYVEGSDGGPVGYVEGVYVLPEWRRRGISAALLAAGEQWAVRRGCRQIGSDLELGNEDSYAFHLGVGFREANRIVCMIKDLNLSE